LTVVGCNIESRTHDYLYTTSVRLLQIVEKSLEILENISRENKKIIKEVDCAQVNERLNLIRENILEFPHHGS